MSLDAVPVRCVVPEGLYATQPGMGHARISSRSHYREPILQGNVGHGRSRRWGDAAQSTQSAAILQIISEARRQRLSTSEAALALAIVRAESGFNPDAAAPGSSASGLGQFIDDTGRAYGLGSDNRFSLLENAKATVAHVQNLLHRVGGEAAYQNQLERFRRVYAAYHDGPNYTASGLKLADRIVLPWVQKFSDWLNGCGGLR